MFLVKSSYSNLLCMTTYYSHGGCPQNIGITPTPTPPPWAHIAATKVHVSAFGSAKSKIYENK